MKLHLKAPDYIVLVSILLSIGAHITTIFLISYYTDVAQDIGERVDLTQTLEANPIMAWIFKLNNLNEIFSIVMVPAFIISLYIGFRMFVNRSMMEEWIKRIVTFQFAMTLFVAFFIDFTHDLAFVLGLLAQNGAL